MLKIKCDKCNKELDKQGALVFSPPCNSKVLKWHLCIECHRSLVEWIKNH